MGLYQYTPDQIMAFGALAALVASFVTSLITLWSIWEFRESVKMSSKFFEVAHRPYFGVINVKMQPLPTSVEDLILEFYPKNHGEIPGYIEEMRVLVHSFKLIPNGDNFIQDISNL